MTRIATIVCLAFLGGCASLPDCRSENPAEEVRSFFVDGIGVPECAVAVSKDGHVRTAGDSHAIFRMGSLTKYVVAEAARRLQKRGDIDLDAPVTQYSRFPLARPYDAVTMRDLMEHRSGLPREFLNPWNPVDWHRALMCGLFGTHLYAKFEEETAFVECLNDETSSLGASDPCYSNVGFALFACSLEDATGKSLDQMVREEISRPLSLTDTAFNLNVEQLRRLMPPCSGKLPWCVPKGEVVDAHELGPVLRGMGGLKSTLSDITKFLTFCGKAARRGFHRCRLSSGREIEYCFGMVYGGSSFVAFDAATDDFVVILANVTSWPAAEDFDLADRLLSAPANAGDGHL